MIENGIRRPPSNASSRRAIPETYDATVGFTAASISVVIARSYSRYSGSTWLDSENTACGWYSAITCAIARSCSAFA